MQSRWSQPASWKLNTMTLAQPATTHSYWSVVEYLLRKCPLLFLSLHLNHYVIINALTIINKSWDLFNFTNPASKHVVGGVVKIRGVRNGTSSLPILGAPYLLLNKNTVSTSAIKFFMQHLSNNFFNSKGYTYTMLCKSME